MPEALQPEVVQFVPHLRPGGMQQIARLLDQALPAQQVRSRLIAVDELPPPLGRLRVLRRWAALVAMLRQDRPAGVLAHAPNTSAFTLTAARLARVPRRIAVVHGSLDSVGAPRARVLYALARAGVLTQVVFVGEAVAASFAGTPLAPRSTVITNGVVLPATPLSSPSSAADAAAADGSPLRLVCAARLVPEKNLLLLLQALAALPAAERVGLSLVICGEGPSRESLEAFAAEHNLRVELPGHVESAELQRRYAEADLFVFPSVIEGLPLVLIEAAAAGLPVIAADTAANREVMGDAGRYAPATDPQAWARLLRELAEPTRREALSAAGRDRAQLFDVSIMAGKYAQLLD